MSYQFNPFTGQFDIAGAGSATTPGGADTQVQFNDGGAFGGDAAFTFNKTTKAVTVGGATVTANAPVFNLSQTWNNSGVTFTGLRLNVTNTASAAASLLLDLQVGGSSVFKVDRTGGFVAGRTAYEGTGAFIQFVNHNDSPLLQVFQFGGVNNVGSVYIKSTGVRALSVGATVPANSFLWDGGISFSTGSAADLAIGRDAANTLAQRNSTNAQESRLYATYTSATSYQRLGIKTGKVALSNVSGASITATSLIPAGAFLIGVTSRVNTALGTSNGTTGYTVGIAGDPDLWGAITGTAEGTSSGSANYTAAGASGLFTSATNVIVTATGGNFDATGVIELAIHYLLTEAD